MIGSVISAGASLIGGLMNRSAAKDAQAANERMAEKNIKLQKQFAQEGIRWKVQDAEAAGIHPAFALGANTNSFTPVNYSATADNSMGNAIASMGQDIGSAVNRTRTAGERVDAFTQAARKLSLTKGALENELLASQIAKLKASANPPMPSVPGTPLGANGPVPEADKFEDRPQLIFGNQKWMTDPTTANMDDFSKRYGDDGLPSWLIPPMIMYQDYKANSATWPARMRAEGPRRGESFHHFMKRKGQERR